MNSLKKPYSDVSVLYNKFPCLYGETTEFQKKRYEDLFIKFKNSFNVENAYVIHGYQYGLRELRQNINLTDDISGLSDLKVKNNMTGEWEDLPAIATPSNDRKS